MVSGSGRITQRVGSVRFPFFISLHSEARLYNSSKHKQLDLRTSVRILALTRELMGVQPIYQLHCVQYEKVVPVYHILIPQ